MYINIQANQLLFFMLYYVAMVTCKESLSATICLQEMKGYKETSSKKRPIIRLIGNLEIFHLNYALALMFDKCRLRTLNQEQG